MLLGGLGIDFTVVPSAVQEDAYAETDPSRRAQALARLKAQDVAARAPDSIVIGCDTLVVAPDGTLLEKPTDAHDAERMLRLQSGGTSIVHSALCVVDEHGGLHEALSSSSVTFAALTNAQIRWWIGTGLWQGRSGAFQIDGRGQLLIARIEGDWTSIVGLPVFELGRILLGHL